MSKLKYHVTCSSLLQMYDLYSRERIDTKADVWVSSVPRVAHHHDHYDVVVH